MVIVVADNEDEARELAANGKAYKFGVHLQSEAKMSGVKLGEPTRVVALPCAEWHEWSD